MKDFVMIWKRGKDAPLQKTWFMAHSMYAALLFSSNYPNSVVVVETDVPNDLLEDIYNFHMNNKDQ